MGIARGRVDFVVAQQLPIHAQALAVCQRPVREAVALVVDPHVFEFGPPANHEPRAVKGTNGARALCYAHNILILRRF